METKGHLLTNPGLRGHSVGENNILSRYVVAYHPEGGIGWIWHDSFEKVEDAATYLLEDRRYMNTEWQIIDTKTDTILYQD